MNKATFMDAVFVGVIIGLFTFFFVVVNELTTFNELELCVENTPDSFAECKQQVEQ